MNKRANKKAFFILLGIGIMYAMMAFDVARVFSMKRNGASAGAPLAQSFGTVAVTRSEAPVELRKPIDSNLSSAIEPALLISLPLVLAAIEEGYIEKEGLIPIKRGEGRGTDFKKPIDILGSKDEEGLKVIADMLGKKRLDLLAKEEGLSVDGLDARQIMLGRGYKIAGKTLLAMYDKHAAAYEHVFPYDDGERQIIKGSKGFEMTLFRQKSPVDREVMDKEWVMPDLTGLSLMAAIEKVSMRTSKIKVSGSGFVVGQTPKAYEKITGEVECKIYGRTGG